MALTKVTGDFIETGSITQGHLHSSHGITTSHITEGDKLFFTNARVDSRVGSLSTSNLSEGTNLYFTNARAISALTAGTNIAIASNGTISSTDTNTTYTVGDGGLTQNNFTNTLKGKLDGIATSANNYSLPFTDNSANWNTAYGWGNHASAGYITSADGGNATTLDGIDSSQFLRSDGNDTFNGNLTVGSTTRSSNTVVKVLSNDSHNAGFEAYGNSQGTGYLYVGQDASYGGGISYNGDGSPLFAMYESADKITFFRRDNNTTREVFSYPYNTDTVTFNGAIYATSGNFSGDITWGNGYKLSNGNNYNNAEVLSATTGAAGIVLKDSAGTFKMQLYGEGGYYGLLASEWGAWDLRKANNGELTIYVSGTGQTAIHTGNYGSYALPLSGGTLSGALTINGLPRSYVAQNSWGYLTQTNGTSNESGIWFTGTTARLLLRDSSGAIKSSISANGSAADNIINGNAIIHAGNYQSYALPLGGGTVAGNVTMTSNYYEFGNGVGSVSNDGSWNARLNVAGSQHARLDVKSVSDGIITTMYSHTGNGNGKVGTMSNHPLALMSNGTEYATLRSTGLGIGAIVSNTYSGAYYGRNHAYPTSELKGYGQEFMIGAQGPTININYRSCNGGTSNHTPTTWYWRAGASNNWSNHNFGNVSANGTITSTGAITTGVSADIKRAGINTTKYISLSGHLSGYGVNDYPTLKTNFHVLYFDAGGVYTGYITSTGGFTDQSDRSLKENIEDIPDALSKVMNLRGRYFTWINELQGNERQVGFIAQEVEEQLPEVVSVGAGDTKGVAYGKVTALLVNAMKEQQAQIELLKQEVELLKQ